MGERFQAHYILKNSKGETYTRAFHLQWCWGHYAIIRLHQVLEYFNVNLKDNYCAFNGKRSWEEDDEVIDILHGLTSLNLSTKSYVYAYHEECIDDDPLGGDNNDGIFIVDLRSETPKYCMLRSIDDRTPEHRCKIISAREYFCLFHGNNPNDRTNDDGDDIKEAYKFLDDIDKYEMLTFDDIIEAYPKIQERLDAEKSC